MSAIPAAKRRRPLIGLARPRLAPPLPARTSAGQMLDVAKHIELELYPWQVTACRYLCARGPAKGWLWPEVSTVVGRQNGKTTVLELLALTRMVALGHRVMHSAQNRELPRESHDWLGDTIGRWYPKLLPRNGIRSSSGQESITLNNGGHYRIAAATRKGARGPSNDLVLIDEVLELDDFAFIAAAKPTTMASAERQIAYFSNAGTPSSVVLASLRLRADSDHNLAYLEWSAAPGVDAADHRAWAQANPSIGHNESMLENLEGEYQANLLGDTLDVWEREHLCRWTPMHGSTVLLPLTLWLEQERLTEQPTPRWPQMGVKVEPDGARAAAAVAWAVDGGYAVDLVADVTGEPVDIGRFGPDLRGLAAKMRVRSAAFDPWTDADLARHLRNAKPLTGREWAAASEKFVELALSHQLKIHDPARILERDLEHTVRSTTNAGTFVAVKDGPESTNTALDAAIRAVWLASAPQPRPMVH